MDQKPRAEGETQRDPHRNNPDLDDDESGGADARAQFARMLEEYSPADRDATPPKLGTKITGRLVLIGEETSFVEYGARSEGAVATHHLRDESGALLYEVGDDIELFVISEEEPIQLGPTAEVRPEIALTQIHDARRNGMPVSGKVVGMNAGGLEIRVAGLRGFCPFSQIEAGYCAEPSTYLGKTVEFLITEIEEKGRNVVLSRRELLLRQEAQRARELLEQIHEGTELDGTVTRLEPFGAFVDLGGVEGLVHVSEVRYGHTDHPRDVLQEGETVRVRVLGVERAQGQRPRISLSIKAAAPDPWDEVEERFWKGRRLSGIVVRLAKFGAFVQLIPGVDGLVHLSEISTRPIKHPSDTLTQGQAVDVVVLDVDTDRRRISLSIRDAEIADAARMVDGRTEAGGAAAATGDGAVANDGRTAGNDPAGSAVRSAGGQGAAAGDASSGGGAQSGTGAAPAVPRTPAVSDVVDGWVAGIKSFGLFVDLPVYGHRARGLVPRDETGEARETDLSKRFRAGDRLKVEVIEVAGDKIRLSLTRVARREEQQKFREFKASVAPVRGTTAMADAFKRALEERKE